MSKNSERLNTEASRPLLNRAIGGDLYPPGSVFKVVTAAAALSSGEYDENSELDGPAELDLPQTTNTLPNAFDGACGPGDKVSFTRALAISCNTAFASVGMDIGADALREQAAKFGFGDSISVPMRVTPSSVPAELDQPQLAYSSIGQYDVRVTPLQMAMVAAGVGNDGVVMNALPRPVRHRLRPVGHRADRPHRALPGRLARRRRAAAADDGRGRRGRLGRARRRSPASASPGKTGTAEHGDDRKAHAWFISFAPADDPQIAVAVIAEDGGVAGSEAGGGRVAAPIAKAMMEARLKR